MDARGRLLALLMLGLGLAATPRVAAQPYIYTPVAFSGSPVPPAVAGQQPAVFTNFGIPALINPTSASFAGQGVTPGPNPTGIAGIYLGGNPFTLTRVADSNSTVPPANNRNFDAFGSPSGPSFTGAAAGNPPLSGVYNGATRIADTTMNAPADAFGTPSTAKFTGFGAGPETIENRGGTRTDFLATGSDGRQGLYSGSGAAAPGALYSVVDTSVQVPGHASAFTGFSAFDGTSNRGYVFSATTHTQFDIHGIYTTDNRGAGFAVHTLAEDVGTTPVPGGQPNEMFFRLGSGVAQLSDVNAADGRAFAFFGQGNSTLPDPLGTRALFEGRFDNQGMAELFKLTQIGVNYAGIGTFTELGGAPFAYPNNQFQISGFGDEVAFAGKLDTGVSGIYITRNGIPTRVVDTTTALFGNKTVKTLTIGRDAFVDNCISFRATFTDGTGGIFIACPTVPEPATATLLATGLVLALAWSKPWRSAEASRRHL